MFLLLFLRRFDGFGCLVCCFVGCVGVSGLFCLGFDALCGVKMCLFLGGCALAFVFGF